MAKIISNKLSTINYKPMLIVVGTNYKYSPIEIREKVSFSKRKIKDALCFLKEKKVLNGAVILSTCNRVEIYASVKEEAGLREIEDFISQYHEISKQAICRYFYRYKDKEAVNHLFSVACGLDSLILGETQVLAQVKFSFLEAENIGFTDDFLRGIFYSAFYFAKMVHLETKLSEGNTCVGSVAIDFIKERVGSLSGKNILIIGTGKVTESILEHFAPEADPALAEKKKDSKVVFISNRTFERAEQLASQIGAKAVKFDDLRQFLNKADIVITATASPHFIIKKELLDGNLKHRILILDLAMPRDVDPQVKETDSIDLFYLEDLSSVIDRNRERKAQEVEKVRNILEKEAEKLWARLLGSQPEPALLP